MLDRILIAATLLACLTAPAAMAQTFDEPTANRVCSAEWPGDFQMTAYCVRQYRDAGRELDQIMPRLDAQMRSRLDACVQEWGHDLPMRAYCLRQQIEARSELPQAARGLPDDVARQIGQHCARQWGEDFQMLAYCTRQQAAAWRELNG